MKSNPQGKPRHLQTSCKQCLFAIYNGITQVGCKANRIQKFKSQDLLIEAYDDDNEFYVIDTLCNQLRVSSWNNGEADVEKAYKEVAPTHTIIVGTQGVTVGKKDAALGRLKNIEYDREKISIILHQESSAPMKEKTIVLQLYNQLSSLGFGSVSTKITISKGYGDHDIFRSVTTGFYSRIDIRDKIPKNLFKKIHKTINKDVVKAVVFEKSNIKVISQPLILGRFMDYGNYEDFESDVIKESKKQNLYINL